MKRKRKIVYVTGTRAEYGVMRSTLRAIDKHPNLQLSLIVTGPHLSKKYGYTVQEIKNDGFKIEAELDTLSDKDTGAGMAESTGKCILGIAKTLEKIKPDILLIEGDRDEMLAAAIVGSHMNIPVVHMSGGDVSGSIDDSVRHAITKLAHIHLASTQKSADRIIKMGEESWRVHIVGTPGMDLKSEKLIKPQKLAKKLDLDLTKHIILVIQHPVTTEVDQAAAQMRKTMDALVELKQQTILIYPNTDAGGRSIIKVIQEYKDYPFIKTYKHISRDVFISLMNVADVMVGNSSSGIVEAPSFNLPVVNIGTRQQGRERADNVIDVDYSTGEILRAIKKALFDKKIRKRIKKSRNPYINDKTESKLVDFLDKMEITPRLLQKKLSYI